MEQEQLTIDVENLTLGHAEFIEEYAGLTKTELIEQIQAEDLSTKAIIALIACQANPDDPDAAIPQVRALKIVDLEAH